MAFGDLDPDRCSRHGQRWPSLVAGSVMERQHVALPLFSAAADWEFQICLSVLTSRMFADGPRSMVFGCGCRLVQVVPFSRLAAERVAASSAPDLYSCLPLSIDCVIANGSMTPYGGDGVRADAIWLSIIWLLTRRVSRLLRPVASNRQVLRSPSVGPSGDQWCVTASPGACDTS